MRKILLVEDHADTGGVISRILGRHHNVRWVDCEADAQAELKVHEFDLVISDIGLGTNGCGLNLMRKYRAEGGKAPAVAMSGLSFAEDIAASINAGFDQHVVKPVDFVVLLDIVNRLTTRRSNETSESKPGTMG